MFDKLKAFFGGAEGDARPAIDPHIAATTLLVEAALSDGIYADCEQDQIKEILAAAFLLDPEAVDRVLDEAEALAEGAIDHYTFTKVVKANLTSAERNALIEQLWMVALADGEKSPFEDAFLRRVAPLLGVDDRERAYARARAEAKAAPR